VDGNSLAPLAAHPRLEEVHLPHGYQDREVVLPLAEALAQQPSTLPPVRLVADFKEWEELEQRVVNAGGRELRLMCLEQR
jgi:hypothetical protein